MLNLISETCVASKAALGQAETVQASSDLDPSLAVLRKDFTSILTILYTLTTKVSLTLRASQAAHSAALPQLKDTVKYISSLTTCATLFEPHGKTLSGEVRKCATDVLESLRAYSDAFTEIVNRGEGSGEDYLVKTGEVHDTIDAARRNLPEDNASAVRKRWSTDRGMVEDSLADVQSMIEDDEADADELEGLDEDEEFDDELDALGLGPTKRLSPLELARVKKVNSFS